MMEGPGKYHDVNPRRDIVVIEDDPDLRNLMQSVLSFAGYEIKTYPNGDEVMKANSFASLYVIDMNLGGVSGIDVCRHLKSKEGPTHPTVIIISANPDARRLAMEACADGTLDKPFKSKNLLTLVKQFLEPAKP
jgi:DNA-binding response OmpR family regulator